MFACSDSALKKVTQITKVDKRVQNFLTIFVLLAFVDIAASQCPIRFIDGLDSIVPLHLAVLRLTFSLLCDVRLQLAFCQPYFTNFPLFLAEILS